MPLDLNGNKLYKTSIGPTGESVKSIITDNLLVHLDAQNINSYNGNGTTWTDLRGNYNGTMYNSPTYNSGVPYNIQLNGTNKYIDFGSFFSFNYFTISLWVNAAGSQNTYADIFDNNHTGDRNFVCQQNADNLNQYEFSMIGATTYSNSGLFTLSTNTWTLLTFTFDGSVARSYKNGSLNGTGGSMTPNWYTPYFRLGCWGGFGTLARFWNGKYGNLMIYNRALTASEILQNYNVQKSRFGL
jgi:hypothetical protein